MLLSSALRARFARLFAWLREPAPPCSAACRRPSLPVWLRLPGCGPICCWG
tara:strand:- start:845 stop:997 length:153 start_codon:yes stop_codon:yes gene_type:complete